MTQKESALILSATDNLFTRLEAPALYVQIQAYRRILSAENCMEVPFRKALSAYIEDVFTPVMDAIGKNRALRKTVREMGVSFIYLQITEELSDVKNITRESYLALVERKTECYLNAA